jgi:EmrB/QacA subfamily drug resistance transporter
MVMKTHDNEGLYQWLALLTVVFGTFMAILDTSIVNIAIPKMMAVYSVSTDQIKWVLTSYMLAMGAVIPLTGYLGDTFGTKKVYLFALAIFTIGSAFCGIAWSNTVMIVARVIQALGGGLIMPVSMSIIYQVIPLEKRGMALGVWGIAAMAAPAIGPTLSGYIIQNLDWHLIFTINIPIGITGFILSELLLKEFPKKPVKKFDLLGFITSTTGLVCILYVLGEGSGIDWNDFSNVFLLTLGISSLILFVINELFHEAPLLDLRLLKIWPFTLSILISSSVNIALYGGIFLLPLFLQNLRGYTPMQTGLLLFPGAVATAITMPISGKLFDKVGAKPIVIPGMIILILTSFELAKLNMDTSSHTITLLVMARGLGLGLAMMPATTAGMNAVPKHLVGRASALSNVIRQVAGSLSITILTTILTTRQVINYTRIAEQVSVFNPNSMQLLKLLQSRLGGQSAAVATLFGVVQKQAFVQAIQDTLAFTVIMAVITLLISLLLQKKPPAKEPVPDEVKQAELEEEIMVVAD